jgi:2-methylcitrate dehydratase PrpD
VQEAQRQLGVKPADITRVRVGSYRAAKEVSGYEDPVSPAEGRFSLKYVVATALVHGSVRLAAFEPARMNDPVTRALMKKIEVVIDPELDAAFPNQRAARVAIDTTDGRSVEYLQPARKGDPELPLTDRDLEDKYLELASPVLGEATAKALVAKLWKLETLPDVTNSLA